MSELKGACIIGQSGGPTSVINASAYGVIRTALDSDCITAVYGAEHGIKGVLADRLFDMSKEDARELELLKYTPSSALGSCRYKIADPDVDDTDYKRILEVFKKHDVRYFFYNGGNDSMDTCNKISKYMQKVGYDCRVMGVPKTIDNDLFGTDHCPGYASAAKYIATSAMEVARDSRVYNIGQITIIECMGRHAGWLTAACSTDVMMMWFPFRLFAIAPPMSARLSDSVPPEVNRISFSCTFRIPAIVFVASFTYFSASTPLRCMADGFPKSSVMVFTTMSLTES